MTKLGLLCPSYSLQWTPHSPVVTLPQTKIASWQYITNLRQKFSFKKIWGKAPKTTCKYNTCHFWVQREAFNFAFY